MAGLGLQAACALVLSVGVLVCGVCAAPSPPAFPAQFVTSFKGVNFPSSDYAGVAYFDLPNIRQRQDSWSLDANGNNITVTTISRYDVANMWMYNWFYKNCTTYYLVGPMKQWAVPSTATYQGQQQVNGYTCEQWAYDFSSDWNEVYETTTSAEGYNWIVQLTHIGQYEVWYYDWLAQEPQPSSLFELPESWNCPPFGEGTPSITVDKTFGFAPGVDPFH